MLIENQRYPGRITPIGIPQSRCRVQFVFGAFEKNRAVRQSDRNATYVWIFEVLFIIAHLDGHSWFKWGLMTE